MSVNQLFTYTSSWKKSINKVCEKIDKLVVFTDQPDVETLSNLLPEKKTVVVKIPGYLFDNTNNAKEVYSQFFNKNEQKLKDLFQRPIINHGSAGMRVLSFIGYQEEENKFFEIDEQRSFWFNVCFFQFVAKQKISAFDFIQISKRKELHTWLNYGFFSSLKQEWPSINFAIVFTNSDSINEFVDISIENSDRISVFQFKDDCLNKLDYISISAKKKTTENFNSGRVYLITGGMGKFGLQLAKYLSSRYQAKVITLGRRSTIDYHNSLLSEYGITDYYQCDIGNFDQLLSTWLDIKEKGFQVDGVIHAAGIINDQLFINKSFQSICDVLTPKVDGLWNLYRLLTNYPVKQFILISSLSSILGNVGQTDYAAANALLDSFARSNPLKKYNTLTTSINFGWLAEGGMQVPINSPLKPIDIAEACELIEYALQNRLNQFITFRAERNLLHVTHEPTNTIHDNRIIEKENLTLNQVKVWLQEIFAKFTKIQSIKYDFSFAEYGIDSIIAMAIIDYVESEFNKFNHSYRLTKTLLFEYDTIEKLSHYLLDNFKTPLLNTVRQDLISETTTDTLKQSETKVSPRIKLDETQSGNINSVDIAIIGIAGLFPKANDVDEYWENLSRGLNCVSLIPNERWDWRVDYDPDPQNPGSYGRHGGFVNDAFEFDAKFFGITPRESLRIDPQERLFLQTSYRCFEDAGIIPGKNMGVFVSAMFGHYQLNQTQEVSIDSSYASIANRISYFYDLCGPSFAIDSMCSGSLVALHIACESIRRNECHTALVGAANIMSHPAKYRLLSQGRFLSPTGKCHTFSEIADGYVPGEGVTAILIKPLHKALENNDRIYAVIKASAVNSTGRSAGYTVPNPEAQAKVIRACFDKVDFTPEDVQYVEAHGTGTKVGDPIEIDGLRKAYSTNKKNYCAIGAVKANIGHLEASAGLAGLIKILLQYKHNKIIPTINSAPVNKMIDFDDSPFYLPRNTIEWRASSSARRRSGISSFGAGGTNAHALLEDFPQEKQRIKLTAYAFCFSAKSRRSLEAYLIKFDAWLRDYTGELYDVSYTLNCTRQHFGCRTCIIGRDKTELLSKLASVVIQQTGFRKVNTGFENYSNLTLGHHVSEEIYYSSLQKASQYYLRGEEIQWVRIYSTRSIISLPGYRFDGKTYRIVNEKISAKNEVKVVDEQLKLLIPKFNKLSKFNISPTSKTKNDTDIIAICDTDEIPCLLKDAGYSGVKPIFIDKDLIKKIKSELQLLDSNKKLNIFLILHRAADNHQNIFETVFHVVQEICNVNVPCELIYLVNLQASIDNQLLLSTASFLKSVQSENPKLASCSVGYYVKHDSDFINMLEDLKVVSAKKNEYRYEQGNWLYRNFETAMNVSEYGKVGFKKNACYLVSGGLGKIGSYVAVKLVKEYSATVICVGRSPLNEEKANLINQINANAANKRGRLIYKQCDITDERQLTCCIKSIINDYETLNGILHVAGSHRDSLIKNKSLDEFRGVLQAKVQGTLNLDYVTKDLELDFFVLFSSISSITGNAGQSDYALANAFQDNFADVRHAWSSRGLRSGTSLSINWPYWLDGGMEISSEQQRFMSDEFGLDAISMSEGWQLLLKALQLRQQVIACKGNLNKMLTFFHGNKFESKDINSSKTKAFVQVTDEFEVRLKDILLLTISKISQLSVNEIELNSSLGDLGLDSILLSELTMELNNAFSINLSPTIFFTYSTPQSLLSYLVKKVQPERFVQIKKRDDSNSSNRVIITRSDEITDEGQHADINDTDIAIIGMAGILPGAENINAFWQNLLNSENIIQPIKRWKNRNYCGGIINNIENFDAKFFGLSAREAMLMDPQHRLFLQTTYQAILDGGYTPGMLDNVGVFAGVQFNDYQFLLQQSNKNQHPYAATGNAHALLANRISYLFNFTGPSQTIDTACSSALIAINQAIKSLLYNECSVAISGAVSLLIDPQVFDAAKSMGILSPNYRCATFDALADGYVRGEGVGCLLLKKYKDAHNDHDPVYAVIKSWSENHGGRAHSLTAPNPIAQQQLLERAYKSIPFSSLSFIETHGTGTQLGDPVEIEALKNIWHSYTNKRKKPIYLGAVKTNVGHLEPAAGIPSIYKTIYALNEGVLPRNMNFKKLNKHISLEGTPFELAIDTVNLDVNQTFARAGISSFGFGGSNAHLVLEKPRKIHASTKMLSEYYFIPFSAKSPRSLYGLSKAYFNFLKGVSADERETALFQMSYILCCRREYFKYRVAFVVKNADQLCDYLDSVSENEFRYIKNTVANNKTSTPENRFVMAQLTEIQMQSLKRDYLSGSNIYFPAFFPEPPTITLHFPGYAFDSQEFWFEKKIETMDKIQ